jgi:predicted acyltransferase
MPQRVCSAKTDARLAKDAASEVVDTMALQSGFVDSQECAHKQVKPARFLAVDLLRGLTIGFMILVNNKGDGAASYWAFKHSTWNGCTPTDLVFPAFVFLVGLSTVFSLSARLARGESRRSLFLHTLRRTIALFLFGMLVNGFPHFHFYTLRFYSVLGRIAGCYFLIATLYLISPKWRSKAVLVVTLLLGYWFLLRYVKVPGYGYPGRDVPFMDRDGNLSAWIDRQLFSSSHLYQETRDPEGLLGTLPALATALLGALTGGWLRTTRTTSQKLMGVFIVGVAGVALGLLWNPFFPFNKALWTSSYVLYSAGWSLLLLAFFMWFVEAYKTKGDQAVNDRHPHRFTGFLVFGMNAIFAYIFSELLQATITNIHISSGVNLQQLVYRGILRVVINGAWASFLYSLIFIGVCWLPMYWLYRKCIFIQI